VVAGQSFAESEACYLLSARGIDPKVTYLTNVAQTLIAVAHSGLGVGFTNELAIAPYATDEVRVLPLADNTVMREVSVFFEATQADLMIASPFWRMLMRTRLPEGVLDARTSGSEPAEIRSRGAGDISAA